MQFHEFGNRSNPVILCLHGMLQNWHTEYEFVKPLEKEFRIIVPAMDGMYPDSPEFTTFVEQCRQMEVHITENYNGHIHGVYGCSQGATVLSELLARGYVKIDVAVFDGIYLAHQGNVAAWFGYKVFSKVKNNGGKFPKAMDVVMKLMGLGKEDYQMFEALYWDVSDISMRNNLYENYNYHLNLDIQNSKTKVYLWCGEKEPYAKKSHNMLKKHLKNYEEKIFENMGHGQMLTKKNKEYMELLRQTFYDH